MALLITVLVQVRQVLEEEAIFALRIKQLADVLDPVSVVYTVQVAQGGGSNGSHLGHVDVGHLRAATAFAHGLNVSQ